MGTQDSPATEPLIEHVTCAPLEAKKIVLGLYNDFKITKDPIEAFVIAKAIEKIYKDRNESANKLGLTTQEFMVITNYVTKKELSGIAVIPHSTTQDNPESEDYPSN